jgi:hypothetical protein
MDSGCDTNVAQLARAAQDVETTSVYLGFEGHRALSQVTWAFPEIAALAALAFSPPLRC